VYNLFHIVNKESQKLDVSGLNALVWKEGDLFVAKAVEVEIVSQGRTKNQALKNLEEALDLYFEDEEPSSKKVKPFRELELHQISGKFNYA